MEISKIVTFVLGFVFMLAVDFIWLGWLAKNFYQNNLSAFLAENFKLAPALLLYLIMFIGFFVFAINPAIETGSAIKALMLGAFVGFLVYSVYDLTNYSTIAGWPIKVVLVDVLWGTVLGGLVSFVTYWISRIVS